MKNLPLTLSPSVLTSRLVELKLNAMATQKDCCLSLNAHAHMHAHPRVSKWYMVRETPLSQTIKGVT